MFTGTTGRVFMLLCVMYFFTYVDRVNLSVAAPIIQKEMSLTNTQLGTALTAFGLCYIVLQIINGYIGGRYGPRRVLSILGCLWAVGTLATGFVGGLASLIGARVLVGLGEAGTIPRSTRVMSNWVRAEQRGFAQGLTHSAARLAAASTPVIVTSMIPFCRLAWSLHCVGRRQPSMGCRLGVLFPG